MTTTNRTTNLRCNIPQQQKKALMHFQATKVYQRGVRAWSLGQMMSEAIRVTYGIDADGNDANGNPVVPPAGVTE